MGLRGRIRATAGRLTAVFGSVVTDHPSNGGITGDLEQEGDSDSGETHDEDDTPDASSPSDER